MKKRLIILFFSTFLLLPITLSLSYQSVWKVHADPIPDIGDIHAVNDGCPASGDPEEYGQCGNDTADDDEDGLVNDGCPQVGPTAETGAQCANAEDDDDKLIIEGHSGILSAKISPWPVYGEQTKAIGITIYGVEAGKCYMVKNLKDKGADDYGFEGSFASQTGGSLCDLDDGKGDICDENPHPPYHGVEDEGKGCVDDDDWNIPDFIRAENAADVGIAGTGGVLRLLSICENMEGIRHNCTDPFDPEGVYEFGVFRVIEPPVYKQENDVSSGGWAEICDRAEDDREKCDPQEEDEDEDEYRARCAQKVDVDTCDVAGTVVEDDDGKVSSAAPGPIDQISFKVEAPPTPGFDTKGTINTPFGPIRTDPAGFAADTLTVALGFAGGVAFLIMVFGAYRLIFAGGNPESIQQGRQVLTSAIIGLLIIIFSVFLLRMAGVGIMGLNPAPP